jgi:hypothetical protein
VNYRELPEAERRELRSEEVGGIPAGQLTAAINANPQLRIELLVHRPANADGTGSVFLVANYPGPDEGLIMLSIPDQLWAMLGRRRRIVARLAIEEE